MDKVCILVGAGEFCETSLPAGDGHLLIAVDGGYDHLCRIGRTPDMLIGDEDSLVEKAVVSETIRLPREKDDTDMRAAIQCGWERGYRRFLLYGGMGGRLDHTLANLQCLADVSVRGGRAWLVGAQEMVTAITNDTFLLPPGRKGTISVFAHSDRAAEVCIHGLVYELERAVLTNGFPIGVSNESDGTGGRISVGDGTLLILYPRGERTDEGGDI